MTIVKLSNDRIYPTVLLGYLSEEIEQQGVSVEAFLRDSDISLDELRLPTTRISYRQIQAIVGNAVSLLPDPLTPFRIGQHFRFTSCGIFGLAYVCSSSGKEAIEFGEKYMPILGPWVGSHFSEANGRATWTFEPIICSDPHAPLYQFAMAAHVVSAATLQSVIAGPDARFADASFVYESGGLSSVYEEALGCPVKFKQPTNSLNFDSRWLDMTIDSANPITMALVRDLCSEMLSDLAATSSIELSVRKFLVAHSGRFPGIEDIAHGLAMHPRTLRRKLEMAGTSYRDILTEVRKHLAIKYLRETRMTHEEIATRLGFSDGANFRQAFKRWTHKQPSAYRIGGLKG